MSSLGWKKIDYLPRAPRKRLGPSTPWDGPLWISDVDGVTTRSATWSCNMTAGAKNEKMERIIAVRVRSGARYKTTAFERPAIMKNR